MVDITGGTATWSAFAAIACVQEKADMLYVVTGGAGTVVQKLDIETFDPSAAS
ncbi:MAG: hypothetical protein ACWA5T_06055 [Parvularcula sp.]